MAEITKDQLITEEAANIFKDLSKDALQFKDTLEGIRSSSKAFSESINDQNTTASKLRETVGGLSDDQKALNQVQNQIAAQNAKLTDAYQTQAKVLADLKEQVRLKTALGEKEAINVTALNSSITQLGIALSANQKAYSNLTTEAARNSEQGLKLKKVITDQNEEFKKLQLSIGITKENVGNYTESIEKAVPAFKKLNPEIVEAGEAMLAFGKKALTVLLNPVVLAIAAVLAGLTLLKQSFDLFTEGTVVGADRAERFGVAWSTSLELVKKQMKALGGTISDVLDKSGISDFFAKSLVYAIGGTAALAQYNILLEQNIKILALQQEIRKEEIVLTVESARLALEKEEEMNAARDKANRSLQERYEALERGDQARIEGAKLNQKAALNELELTKEIIGKKGIEINAQTDLNELFKDDLATRKLSYEQFELIANAQKKLIDAQKEEFEGTRRIQALRSSLLDEQIKLIQDAAKEERDAQIKLNEETIKTDQAKNARILANQSATLEEKVKAETNNMLDLESLNDKQTSDELFALREKGLQEIILDKETNAKINLQAGDNLKLRAQLILDAKNKEYDADARFQNEVALLLEAGKKREEEIVKKSAENVVKITLDKAKQVAEAETSQSKVGKDQALIALNESLSNREISIIEFQKRKGRIEAQGDIEILNNEIDGLEKQKEVLKNGEQIEGQYAQDILKIDQQIADKKKDISDKSTKLLEENLKKQYELEKQFANQSLDTIKTVGDNQTNAKIQVLEDQLSALQENENKQLELAGNNEAAKVQIQKRFAQEQERIRKEEAKLKHDQAVKDKLLDEAKIIINTAVGVSEALASYNYVGAVLIAALGALELTKVESTPIPAYYLGTEDHPGGKALVGEQGTELLTLPSGQLKLTPNRATVMDLPAGTEVLPNKETMKVLALAGLANSQSANTIPLNMTGVITEIKGLRADMKNNKPRYPNYARMASGVYELRQESDTHIKRVLALSGNH